jgi:DNA polymerase III subunit epsilon
MRSGLHPRLLMIVRDCRFTAIDFESAGAAPGRTDAPVQIGLAAWSPTLGHGEVFMSYLRTDQPVTWAARKVHGIGPEHLADAPALLSLWPELKTRLVGAVVVAHGKGTEKRFLRTFPGHGFGPWIDTLLLSRAAWPELKDHSLGAVASARGLTEKIETLVPGKRWHDALYDAVASLVLLENLVSSFALEEQPLDLLVTPDTSVWHRMRR